MREDLLKIIYCPVCASPFDLVIFKEYGGVVEDGLLVCKDGQHVFPIVRSLPRLLSNAFEQEASFYYEHREEIDRCGSVLPENGSIKLQGGTMKSFGREWNTFQVLRPDEDLAYFCSKTGVKPESLRGKIVLEAGCGSGRYARQAGKGGAQVIGVDISLAVETAAKVNIDLPNVHIIQADIFHLPFHPSTFDFIYSIGVLHHTPDTHRAFSCLPPLLKENGEIAIWVYPRWPLPVELYNRFLRAITTRMSLESLHRLAERFESLGLLKLKLLTSQRVWDRAIGQLLRVLTIGVSYHPDREIRICDTFDWFSPPYQWHHTNKQIESWFHEYGLSDVVNLSINQTHYQFNYGNGVNYKGRRLEYKKGKS